MKTLLLNAWMTPHTIVPWQRAVVLVLLGKVDVLEEYDEEIRSKSVTLRTPAVVRLRTFAAPRKRRVRFSRSNVFLRDGFRCQYCGERKGAGELNLDHVVPRAKGGPTTWENIVASCYPCNERKGGRTPEEAGMRLRKRPFKPRTLLGGDDALGARAELPAAWKPYCASASVAV
jgi:5-methylcytosine-specific restriction endonuclease McrA